MTVRSILVSTIAAVVLIGTPALAEEPESSMPEQHMMGPGMMGPGMMGPGMMGPGMMSRGGMMGMMAGCPMMGAMAEGPTYAEGRIAFLKAELGVTDAQKAAWDTYAEAIRHNLQSMKGMRQGMKAVMEAKTPVERLDAHIGAMEGRLAALKEVKPALAALYGALSPEQQKKANGLLTGMGCMM